MSSGAWRSGGSLGSSPRPPGRGRSPLGGAGRADGTLSPGTPESPDPDRLLEDFQPPVTTRRQAWHALCPRCDRTGRLARASIRRERREAPRRRRGFPRSSRFATGLSRGPPRGRATSSGYLRAPCARRQQGPGVPTTGGAPPAPCSRRSPRDGREIARRRPGSPGCRKGGPGGRDRCPRRAPAHCRGPRPRRWLLARGRRSGRPSGARRAPGSRPGGGAPGRALRGSAWRFRCRSRGTPARHRH
jgi:hypothetical protein